VNRALEEADDKFSAKWLLKNEGTGRSGALGDEVAERGRELRLL
jgi:hypothetical protein